MSRFGDWQERRHSAEYIAHLRSPEWAVKRRAVLERTHNVCQGCGASGSAVALEVHHLTYERLGMLQKAEQETLLSLRLRPDQNDARNTLGIIYAEEGNYIRASQEWEELNRANPDYKPARANLAILERVERGTETRTRQSGGFAQAP